MDMELIALAVRPASCHEALDHPRLGTAVLVQNTHADCTTRQQVRSNSPAAYSSAMYVYVKPSLRCGSKTAAPAIALAQSHSVQPPS